MHLVPDQEYDLSEAAQFLDLSESTLERWIATGRVTLTGGNDVSSGEYKFTAQDLKALRTQAIALAIDSVIDEPDEWLDSPNPWMGGHSPRELLGTDREQLVIDVIEGIKHGAVA